MEKNIFLKIAYDGTNFSGWQRQPGTRTVCGELESVISRISNLDIKLNGTSRTDAGVHAYGQCASFKSEIKIPAQNLAKAINNALAEDRLEGVGEIRILEAKEVDAAFHARFSSSGKRYIYKISNASAVDIFKKNYFYQITQSLDVASMRKAAAYIIGEHDFACFQSAGSPKESTVRTVYALDIKEAPDNEIDIVIEGNGFLYNMVRIIVGTLVEVGLGKRKIESVKEAIDTADRLKAGHVAPPQGLYLDEVFY